MAGSGRVPPRGAARRSLLPSLQEQIWNKQSPRCKTNSCVGGRGSVLHTISIKYSVFGKHEGWQTQHGEGGTHTHTHTTERGYRLRGDPAAEKPTYVSGSCAAFRSPKIPQAGAGRTGSSGLAPLGASTGGGYPRLRLGIVGRGAGRRGEAFTRTHYVFPAAASCF